jgi:hypothetical protein
LGQFASFGVFYGGYTTFSIIVMRSSFALRTVPTLVFAAKAFTVPKDFVLTLDVWNC